MASTITLTGDWLSSIGSKRLSSGTGNLGNPYAAGGIAVSAAQLGLGVIESFIIDPAGGYVFEYVPSTGKVKAYRSATFTPAGTVAAPVFTGSALATHVHDFKLMGAQAEQAAGSDNIVSAVEATKVIGKEEAGDTVIAGADSATKGGVVAVTAGTPAGTNSAPAFTGDAVAAAALAEVGAINLSGVTFSWRAIGY